MTKPKTKPRPYSRHGLNALKARIKVRGLAAIDARTAAARGLLAWRKDLLDSLGGEPAVSPQKLALVELAVRTRLYIDHLDAWLMEQRSLVNVTRKSVLPIVLQRQQLADSLSRLLGQLGLERVAKPVPALGEYLAKKYGDDKADPESGNQDAPAGSGSRKRQPVEPEAEGSS